MYLEANMVKPQNGSKYLQIIYLIRLVSGICKELFQFSDLKKPNFREFPGSPVDPASLAAQLPHKKNNF